MTVALNPRTRGPRRALLSFVAIILALGALVIGARTWGTGQLTPKLGLDLEGGTQMVLEPVLADPNAEVSSGQLEKARDIIAQRVSAVVGAALPVGVVTVCLGGIYLCYLLFTEMRRTRG